MLGESRKKPVVPILVAVVVVAVVISAILFIPRPSTTKVGQTPSAPQDLTAEPGDKLVTLRWQPPRSNGSSPVQSYNIYRSTAPGAEVFLKDAGTALMFTDSSNLVNGQTYYYKVSASNSEGEGARSNEVSAVPGAVGAVPSAPRNLAASPGDGRVTLTWDPPQNAGGSPISGYLIYRGTSPGMETLLIEIGSIPGYTNTGLTNGQTYYYMVSARNSAGIGPRSAEAGATPVSGPSVPSAPRNLVATPGVGNITLTWDPPESDGRSQIIGYKVYRRASSGAEVLLATLDNLTVYVDSGLMSGYTFYYTVAARNILGDGARSAEVSCSPFSKPSAPRNLRATAGLGSVSLSWDIPESDGGTPVLNYNVYRGTAPGGEMFLLMWSSTTYLDPSLINGTAYYYKVSASNALGEGPQSDEASATPQASFDAPSAPRNLAALPGDGSVSLGWDPPLNEGGAPVSAYTVYRNGTLLTALGVVTQYLDSGLANGVSYSYEVSASNSIGESPRSAPVAATPATRPGAPRDLAAAPGNRLVTLTWLPPDFDGGSPVTNYTIMRNGSVLATIGAVTSYTDRGLINGVLLVYKVAAVNRVGQGEYSSEAGATPEGKPVLFGLGSTGQDYGQDIGTDSQGNYYLAGYFSGTVDFDPGTGAASLTAGGIRDGFVAKYDLDGKYLWVLQLGGPDHEEARALYMEPSGSFVVAGCFRYSLTIHDASGAAPTPITGLGGWDAFVAKFDTSGIYQWASALGGPGDDVANDVSEDSSGNLYLTGTFNGTVDFDPGAGIHTSNSNSSEDCYVCSWDKNGAYRWHFTIGSMQADGGYAIATYANGTFFVAGQFNDSVDFDPGAEVNLTNSSGKMDIFLARYDTSGKYLWAGALGGPGDEMIYFGGMSFDSSGNVYLTGSFQGEADFLPTNLSATLTSNGEDDLFLAEYDQFGEYRWAMGVGGPLSDGGTRVAIDSAGSIYLTGWFQGTMDFDPGPDEFKLTAAGTGGAVDIFLAKYSPGGLFSWAHGFGDAVSGAEKWSFGAGICVDAGGNVIITGGFFGSVDFDTSGGTQNLSSAGLSDLFVARYDADGKLA